MFNALMGRLRSGDAKARNLLLMHLEQRLRGLAHRQLRNFPGVNRWEQTDDLLQKVLLRIDRALTDVDFQDPRHLLAISALHLRRELLDLARHYQGPQGIASHHKTNAPRGDQTDTPEQQFGSDTYDPARLARWTEFHQQVEQLPAELRPYFDLVFYQGLTHAQAAEILQCSEKQVYRKFGEARKIIGQYLENTGTL
jgi:RNA polymerase sigma-70 factor (ECF subfamily)